MSDRYQAFSTSAIGKLLVKNLGLPDPVVLDRWSAGSPIVRGNVVVGGAGRVVDHIRAALEGFGVDHLATHDGERVKALILDATGLRSAADLHALREFFGPVMRSLDSCARLIVVGSLPEQCHGSERVAQRALEGFTRSLGKEVGRGSTATLILVADGAEAAIDSTLAFVISPKSAYVSGQVIRIGATGTTQAAAFDVDTPLAGQVAVVTGAARGIGEQIARVLHRDGATVVGIDVPQAASDLKDLAEAINGDYLTLDITAPDAPARIAHELKERHGGLDAIVHNAGITRDKRLANMDAARWDSVIAVNLTAPELITRELLTSGVLRPNGRIVGVSSIAGIAGNVGQTNYAASKAGVIGLVDSLAHELRDGITINAVAPGFIETKMTAAVPLMTREVGRRLNALSQGGQPVDVAEAVAWYLSPGSTAVNGNVVRVCGQMMLGA
ncbi:MAG: 3-oxoacyl-ACP reductase [Marmoricola sp.]